MHKKNLFKKKFIFILIAVLISISILMHSNSSFRIPDNERKLEPKNAVIKSLYDQLLFNVFYISDLGQVAYGATSADFNSDGYFDFAVSSATHPFNNSTISIFYNQGNSNFTRDDVYIFDYSYIKDLDSGDYDNDGDIDFIFTYSEWVPWNGYKRSTNGTINMLYNDGSNNFGNLTMIAWFPGIPDPEVENRINNKITSSDYDLDGDIDFLTGDNTGVVELFLNDGSGGFISDGIIHNYSLYSWGLTSADFDGDGDIDFLVSETILFAPGAPGFIYFKNNQLIESNFSYCFDLGPGEIASPLKGLSVSMTPLDYDNDQDVDFIAGIEISVYLCINEQGIYKQFLIGQLPYGPEGYPDHLNFGAVTSADYNNDGWDDFVVGGVNGAVRLCINTGSKQLPPNKPAVHRSATGKVGEKINFTFVVEDPNDDDIYLSIGWYNGTEELIEWLGPYASGEEVVLSYSWENAGSYGSRCRARDVHGNKCDWQGFVMEISKTKSIDFNPFLQWLLEQHPCLFPILRHLLKIN